MQTRPPSSPSVVGGMSYIFRLRWFENMSYYNKQGGDVMVWKVSKVEDAFICKSLLLQVWVTARPDIIVASLNFSNLCLRPLILSFLEFFILLSEHLRVLLLQEFFFSLTPSFSSPYLTLLPFLSVASPPSHSSSSLILPKPRITTLPIRRLPRSKINILILLLPLILRKRS
jgi:hypothetical protein